MKADNAPAAGTNFVPTFLIYQSGGPTLTQADLPILAKYDILYFGRFRYDQIGGDTWSAIRKLRPDVPIYLYEQGPDIWRFGGHKSMPTDEMDVKRLNNIARYLNARSHSMGNLSDDNPDLFLLKSDGRRTHTYEKDWRYLMDFGSQKFQQYWLEATCADIVDREWAADGIFIDNTGVQQWVYPTETPAKYDTDEKWWPAMREFHFALTRGLHANGQKSWTNTCGTLHPFAFDAWLELDAHEDGPDLLAEEGAFAHGWGGNCFYNEQEWTRQVDIITRLKRAGITVFAHTQLNEGQAGTDEFGRPVTYWQTLWYSLGSFLLGKNDVLNNSYFAFFAKPIGYRKLYWYDEYERIDLGKALAAYERVAAGDGHVYCRPFEAGYVYVNPTMDDVAGIKLPEKCRRLTHETLNDEPGTLATIESLDLPSHHAGILVKASET